MTYQISIALIHDNQIEDTLNATCSRTYDARVLIESLCNGWQMSSKRIVLINGKLLAIGNPRAIREQLSQHPMRSEEHTSELQSLMRISYAVSCLKKKKKNKTIKILQQ